MDASMSRILFRCAVINAFLTAGLSVLFGAVGAAAALVATAILMTISMASVAKRNQLTFWKIPQERVEAVVISVPVDG
jgi:O-antigen/teichoic acid export membrane protein